MHQEGGGAARPGLHQVAPAGPAGGGGGEDDMCLQHHSSSSSPQAMPSPCVSVTQQQQDRVPNTHLTPQPTAASSASLQGGAAGAAEVATTGLTALTAARMHQDSWQLRGLPNPSSNTAARRGSQDAQLLARIPSTAVRAAAAAAATVTVNVPVTGGEHGSMQLQGGNEGLRLGVTRQGSSAHPLLYASTLDTGSEGPSSLVGGRTGLMLSGDWCAVRPGPGAAADVGAGGAPGSCGTCEGSQEWQQRQRREGGQRQEQQAAGEGAHTEWGTNHAPEITPATPSAAHVLGNHTGVTHVQGVRPSQPHASPMLLQLPAGVLEAVVRATGPAGMRSLRLACTALRGCVDGGVRSLVVDGPHVDPGIFPRVEHITVVLWQAGVGAGDLAPTLRALPHLLHLKSLRIRAADVPPPPQPSVTSGAGAVGAAPAATGAGRQMRTVRCVLRQLGLPWAVRDTLHIAPAAGLQPAGWTAAGPAAAMHNPAAAAVINTPAAAAAGHGMIVVDSSDWPPSLASGVLNALLMLMPPPRPEPTGICDLPTTTHHSTGSINTPMHLQLLRRAQLQQCMPSWSTGASSVHRSSVTGGSRSSVGVGADERPAAVDLFIQAHLQPEGARTPRTPLTPARASLALAWDDGAEGDPSRASRPPASSPMHTAHHALTSRRASIGSCGTGSRSGIATGTGGSTPVWGPCTASAATSASPFGRWSLPHVAVHLQQPLALSFARDLITLSHVTHRIADLRLDIPSHFLLPPAQPPMATTPSQPPSPASPFAPHLSHSTWSAATTSAASAGPCHIKAQAPRVPPLLTPLAACAGLRRLDLNFHEWAPTGSDPPLDEASGFPALACALASSLTHLTLRGDVTLPPSAYEALSTISSLTSLTLWLKVFVCDEQLDAVAACQGLTSLQVARLAVEERAFHPVLPQVSALSYYITRGPPGCLSAVFPHLNSASLRDWPALTNPQPLAPSLSSTVPTSPPPSTQMLHLRSAPDTAARITAATSGAGVARGAGGRGSRRGSRASGSGGEVCGSGVLGGGVQHLTLLQHTYARIVQPWGDLGPRMVAHTAALRSLTNLVSITLRGVTHTSRLRDLCEAAGALPHLISLTLQAAPGAPPPPPPPARSQPDTDRVPFELLTHLRTLNIDCQGWAWDVVSDLTRAVHAGRDVRTAVHSSTMGSWLRRVATLGRVTPSSTANNRDGQGSATWGRSASMPCGSSGSSRAAVTGDDEEGQVVGRSLTCLQLTSLSAPMTLHGLLQLLMGLPQLVQLEIRGCCGPLSHADAVQIPAQLGREGRLSVVWSAWRGDLAGGPAPVLPSSPPDADAARQMGCGGRLSVGRLAACLGR